MPLPAVSPEELKFAKRYAELALGDSPVPEGEEFYHLLARYFVVRSTHPELLRGGEEAPPSPQDLAWRVFCSAVCPACGEAKRASKDFFGPECWRMLVKGKLHGNLWQGWKRGMNISQYIRALAFLREQGRAPAGGVR